MLEGTPLLRENQAIQELAPKTPPAESGVLSNKESLEAARQAEPIPISELEEIPEGVNPISYIRQKNLERRKKEQPDAPEVKKGLKSAFARAVEGLSAWAKEHFLKDTLSKRIATREDRFKKDATEPTEPKEPDTPETPEQPDTPEVTEKLSWQDVVANEQDRLTKQHEDLKKEESDLLEQNGTLSWDESKQKRLDQITDTYEDKARNTGFKKGEASSIRDRISQLQEMSDYLKAQDGNMDSQRAKLKEDIRLLELIAGKRYFRDYHEDIVKPLAEIKDKIANLPRPQLENRPKLLEIYQNVPEKPITKHDKQYYLDQRKEIEDMRDNVADVRNTIFDEPKKEGIKPIRQDTADKYREYGIELKKWEAYEQAVKDRENALAGFSEAELNLCKFASGEIELEGLQENVDKGLDYTKEKEGEEKKAEFKTRFTKSVEDALVDLEKALEDDDTKPSDLSKKYNELDVALRNNGGRANLSEEQRKRLEQAEANPKIKEDDNFGMRRSADIVGVLDVMREWMDVSLGINTDDFSAIMGLIAETSKGLANSVSGKAEN